MLELNGKNSVKLIENMVDVVYFKSYRPYRSEHAKYSRRGAYELYYNSWYNEQSGYNEYKVKLRHYGTVIFEYTSRGGIEQLHEIYVCSDSDRNAINTLIEYLGLIHVTIWRNDWTWYVKMPTRLNAKHYRVPGREFVPTRGTETETFKFD